MRDVKGKGQGKGRGNKSKDPVESDEVKGLRQKLEHAKRTLEDDPENAYLQGHVRKIEAAIETAAPKDEVQTSDLQRQLEYLQEQIVADNKIIDDKLAFAKKKAEEVQNACLQSTSSGIMGISSTG